MMNNETMVMLAKFIFAMRKLNIHVDSNRLTNEANYRDEIFKAADTQGDEDLLMLSLSLNNNLGLFSNVPAVDQLAKQAETSSTAGSQKYMFGARG